VREYRQYIGGEWVSADTLFDDLDPYRSTVMARIRPAPARTRPDHDADHRVVGHEQGRAVEGQWPGAGVAEPLSLLGLRGRGRVRTGARARGHPAGGQVVEQFERADHALARLLAMSPRRLPQGTARPSPALSVGGCAGAVLRRTRCPGRARSLAATA
jgi:hypothetical protein